MYVAIALTLVVSQLTHKDYRDLAITFHENPTVHHFADCKTSTPLLPLVLLSFP